MLWECKVSGATQNRKKALCRALSSNEVPHVKTDVKGGIGHSVHHAHSDQMQLRTPAAQLAAAPASAPGGGSIAAASQRAAAHAPNPGLSLSPAGLPAETAEQQPCSKEDYFFAPHFAQCPQAGACLQHHAANCIFCSTPLTAEHGSSIGLSAFRRILQRCR